MLKSLLKRGLGIEEKPSVCDVFLAAASMRATGVNPGHAQTLESVLHFELALQASVR